MISRDLNETPIQRLQRETRELSDLVHKCVQGVAALNDLDDLRSETNEDRFTRLETRVSALSLLVRAMTTEPVDVAERMLRSVDDE